MIGKKSQAEIVGLVIIVLLITVGLLFFVRFVVLKPNSDAKRDYVDSELASNMINVLLKTTTDCKKSTMSDLFRDCAGFNRIDCDDDGNRGDSREKIEEVIEEIFNNTLEKWEKPYHFKAYIVRKYNTGENTIVERSYGKCSGNVDRISRTYVIPTDMESLMLTLDICS
ncbi:MAG: hypothetical protein PHV16_03500 [Candidatus Nanoarchaeia archaeon]|nr:hypothetical protein [Candidatus Nanoarchaeia archaeon]